MTTGPRGVWLIATAAHGRPAPATDPYPHICSRAVTSPRGQRILIRRRDCAACQEARDDPR